MTRSHILSFSSPYTLTRSNGSSDEFYQQLDVFTGCVLRNGESRFFKKGNFNFSICPEEAESKEDLLLDILISGTLWNEYKGYSKRFAYSKNQLFKFLFYLRNRNAKYKPVIDKLRGNLLTRWLTDKRSNNKPTLSSLRKLALYLESTGDFGEESKRIYKIIEIIKNHDNEKQQVFINEMLDFSFWFKSSSISNLGSFTREVRTFLNSHSSIYKNREDYFLCGRKEVEYHLNMVGATILNRNLKDEFLKTEKQILMLPTCMSASENCKAYFDGTALRCAHCNPECNVSRTSLEMKKSGIETILIKHSSDIAKSLNPWVNQKKTGLIGTACVLNLLQGGFEMKKLSIPSQCVYLDYCGCKKHWDQKGTPTNMNINRVLQLVTA